MSTSQSRQLSGYNSVLHATTWRLSDNSAECRIILVANSDDEGVSHSRPTLGTAYCHFLQVEIPESHLKLVDSTSIRSPGDIDARVYKAINAGVLYQP